MRLLGWALLLVVLLAGAWLFVGTREDPLPTGLAGTIVYVSDREGMAALYARRLPHGQDQRLTFLTEPVRDPAIAPDGRRVAFSVGGRIGLVSLASGDVQILTLGIDWRDAEPSWRPDGLALVVVARHPGDANADVHLIVLPTDSAKQAERQPITLTPGIDEASPVFGPDGTFVVFVRQDHLMRVDLANGRARHITGGFRRMREPRFLPSGRLMALWTQEKAYGIDVMDTDGKNRETLSEGSTYYRTVAPSPDGRFLAATYTFDLGFHPREALQFRQTEDVRVLDAAGHPLAFLARSWRHANHSPTWGR